MRSQRARVEQRGVSEVLGVLLMLTVTIVLAALVSTFVLGTSTSTQTTPSATFSITYDDTADELTIQHRTGNQIIDDQLYIRGDCDSCSEGVDKSWADYASAQVSGTVESQSAVSSGDSLTLTNVGPEYDIMVVWQSEKGDLSAKLGEDEGPDA